jgi:hypothetical protein
MPKDVNKFRKVISAALDEAFSRALEKVWHIQSSPLITLHNGFLDADPGTARAPRTIDLCRQVAGENADFR